MLVVIDNYDSFTFNLVQYFYQLRQNIHVVKNDDITLNQLIALEPQFLVISPGPKSPTQAGISIAAINYFFKKIPILGVCLGHQCIAHAFSAEVSRAAEIMHGKTSTIRHNNQRLFKKIPNDFQAMRYHSLAIKPSSLSREFIVDAWADETIMAISHRDYPIYGVQFHPESILTENGMQLLRNFIRQGEGT